MSVTVWKQLFCEGKTVEANAKDSPKVEFDEDSIRARGAKVERKQKFVSST